ncbi:SMP-30/Gluconolactonase/LRE-like region domain-containing protein [Madurella fahalii]|uniref:SMP-30/Gluconolactonase/LRE-like region domain-containing protein n=1 Tax=Madurella fahalii TaxID=1157608 RepID=A0ABQ0G4P6_9PEZI
MHRLLVLLRVLLSLASLVELAACGKRSTPSPVTSIYQFPDDTFIENLFALPSGHILLTTFNSGNLLSIDPRATTPTPQNIAKLGDATGLTAIAALPLNLYAVAGGIHGPFSFVNNTMALYVVLVMGHQLASIVVASIPVPGTMMMNGLAALPHRPFTVLSADSIGGRLLRINTVTRQVDVAWTDAAFGSGGNPNMPLGINGLKIVGDWLYFTNSGRGTFARVPIDHNGNKVGSIQVIATLPTPANMTNAYDDFDFDRCGNAYVALHSSSVVKITPSGQQTVVAGGPGAIPKLKSPTSVSTAPDGKSIYISTGGGEFEGPTITGGQVLELELPSNC